MSAATVCPKCGHARADADAAPAWQCPSCGIAYRKYGQVLDRSRSLVRPPRAGEAAPPASLDGSVWALLLANLIAIGVAIVQRWSLPELVAVYWVQSVVICVSYAARIAALERFTTDGLLMNGRPVPATPETRRKMVYGVLAGCVFVLGLFYVFLVADQVVNQKAALFTGAWFWVAAALFAANHAWSYRYNRALDRSGTPNIGNMLLTPFIRVVPMYLILGLGYFAVSTLHGVIVFAVMKTAADVALHVVEHARLRRVAPRR